MCYDHEYISNIIRTTIFPYQGPSPKWREIMEQMSDAACNTYREVVYKTPKFVEYPSIVNYWLTKIVTLE
jgi:phosphoenolpyruvate carboxylase